MTWRKTLVWALTLATLLVAAACGAAETESDPAAAQKPVLLAVSFGTSYNESRAADIDALEASLQEAYPDYEVRRAFTSQIIIDILEEREGLEIDNVTEAMDRLVADGVTEVVIQPTHVIPGFEYDDVMAEVSAYAQQFSSFKTGLPLLSDEADFDQLVTILTEKTASYSAEGTAVVFMGHGTEHEANAAYAALQQKFIDAGAANYFVGTVEAEPTLEDVMAQVEDIGAAKVVLLPLMMVAGDHACNDMAGDEEGSWKATFEEAGYEVECVLEGLGRSAGVQEMLASHAAAAMAE